MNSFDLIVLGIIAASALFAFLRGFVRESLGILAWLGAAAAAIYLYEPLRPIFERIIPVPWLVLVAEPIIIFVIALILLSIIVGMLSSGVRKSGFGPMDRGLGLLFGLARGALVVCILVIALDYYLPVAARPGWIKEARTLPMIESGAEQLKEMVPPDLIQRGSDAAENAIDKVDRTRKLRQDLNALHSDNTSGAAAPDPYTDDAVPAAPAAAKPSGNYSSDQQRQLDQAVQQATDMPPQPAKPRAGSPNNVPSTRTP